MNTTAAGDLLLVRCLQGDRRAQFELYQTYSKAMFNVCLRILGDRQKAEDALQNAFVDVFGKMESFRGESSLGAWIKRIVINSCLNQLKKKKVMWVDPEQTLMNEKYEEYEEGFNEYDVQYIKDAILQLPEGYRVVFSLYLLEGYDHAEIGEILGITEGASKSQYSRARQKLAQMLRKQIKTG